MKKLLLITIILFGLLVNPVTASNSYTAVLDGSTEYYSLTGGMGVTGDMTIMAWINMDELPSANGEQDHYVSEDSNTGANRDYSFFAHQTVNWIFFDWFTSAGTFCRGYADSDAFTSGDVGAWVHIAVTVDVSEEDVKIYKNGSSLAVTLAVAGDCTNIRNSGTALTIGRRGDAYGEYDGKLDDVKIYDRVLTPTEISDEYNCEIQTPYDANLQAYYKFDSQDGTDSANSNTLTENNTPTYQSASLPFTNSCTAPPTPPSATTPEILFFN